jgi:glycosyltransferase involved in cell wall biosynthesis
MWHGQSVSLIYPTYRERDSICQQIVEAAETGWIDEVVVVNNNAEAGTSEEVARAARIVASRNLPVAVREVFEPTQGYGASCLRGLDEATGYYRCLSEPDGTFVQRDIGKLLEYTDRCDFVLGSRTVKTFIWTGANMWWFLRIGNWAVAKLLEMLFNTTSLSDVGCTMRAIKFDAYARMRPHLTIAKSFFGPQMMLVAHLLSVPVVQIPVNYCERVGMSSVTGDFRKAFSLGLKMIALILQYRLLGLRAKKRVLIVPRVAPPVAVTAASVKPEQIVLMDVAPPARISIRYAGKLTDAEFAAFCAANPHLRLARTGDGEILLQVGGAESRSVRPISA